VTARCGLGRGGAEAETAMCSSLIRCLLNLEQWRAHNVQIVVIGIAWIFSKCSESDGISRTAGQRRIPKGRDFPHKNRIMAAIRLAVFW